MSVERGDGARRGADEDLLDHLFQEFLEAEERGQDLGAELLERADGRRAELEERIALHRSLAGAVAPAERAEPTGEHRRIGRFEILGTLGEGGLSTVFLAHDPMLNRRIALKILRADQALKRSQHAVITTEASGLARIEHRGVVKVFEAGRAGPFTYLTMELLQGPSLADVVAAWRAERARAEAEGDDGGGDDGPVEPGEGARRLAEAYRPYTRRIELLLQLADALAHCHDRGILHRDVKPDNVLFDTDGEARLIDFGLAHLDDHDSNLGHTGSMVGTAPYMAPEQVRLGRTGADPRSDQFSLAVVAYECIALENPFLREGSHATRVAIEEHAPAPLRSRDPAVPPDLARVIHHALAKEPEDRYPGVAALAGDLRRILRGEPISVSSPSLAHVLRLWWRRNRRTALPVLGTTALGLLAVLVLWMLSLRGERADLLGDLEAIRPSAFESSDELFASFQSLLDLRGRARTFDAGAGALLTGEVGPRVEALVHEWSRSLQRLHARDRELALREGVVFQDLFYRELMQRDRILCPDCPYNESARLDGRVIFPTELLEGRPHAVVQLTHQETPPPLTLGREPDILHVFRPTQLAEALVPGCYRLLVWQGADVWRESAFWVPEKPGGPVEVVLRERRADLFEEAVPLTPKTHVLAAGGEVAVPPSRVLPRMVSSEEFAEFVRETNYEAAEFQESLEPYEPAVVGYDAAMAFAAWAGGRLPTFLELFHAGKAGELFFDDPVVSTEFLLDMAEPIPESSPAYLIHSLMRRGMVMAREAPILPMGTRPTTFRVAFSTREEEIRTLVAEDPPGK